MKLSDFANLTELYDCTEIEKVRLVAFYFLRIENLTEFVTKDVTSWFQTLGLAKPNQSRLEGNLRKSKIFIRGSKPNSFQLHANEIRKLDLEFSQITTKSEEVISTDTILPKARYEKTRGYIELLAKQINASYENNIFDGCAVLMRRLLEVLLIHSYENLKIDSQIRDNSGNYYMLERIVSDAKSNTVLNLSRNAKEHLDVFRTLGNFSAHKIYYNCTRSDIQKVILEYRATIEELLYKSGIRT